MSEGHTPGPWDFWSGYNAVDKMEAEITADDGDIVIARYNHLIGEGEANARLIAAAPELLEALEQVCLIWDHHCDAHGDGTPSEAHARVRAAIAKAKGQPC
jgi:hypothetical protein